jgi:thiol-disulfide isomerase/thioredoxin
MFSFYVPKIIRGVKELFLKVKFNRRFKNVFNRCLLYLVLALVVLPSCFGRIKDVPYKNPQQTTLLSELGLTENKPALLVFGAVWCKPCRKEIPELNSLALNYSQRLSVSALLVEGKSKGVAPSVQDLEEFVGPSGVKPNYSLVPDTGWSRFDFFKPALGRALPLFVILDSTGKPFFVAQGSLDFQSELVPQIEKILKDTEEKGSNSANSPQANSGVPLPVPAPGVEPVAVPTPLAVLLESRTVQKFVEEEVAREPEGIRPKNLEVAWKKGLAEFGFSEIDMPFSLGTIRLKLLEDGSFLPMSAIWKSSSCTLTVVLDADAAYVSARGICRE